MNGRLIQWALAALLAICACSGVQAQEAINAPGLVVASVTLRNDATFVSQSVPVAMTAGISYDVSVTMKNTGTASWALGGNYFLGSQNPQDNLTWGGNRVAVSGTTTQSGQRLFAFRVTAPSVPGVYTFQWRMVEEYVEWFGQSTPAVMVIVSAPRNDAQVTAQSVPASMTAGQGYDVSVTVKNTGGTTWTTGGKYFLGSQNPGDNLTWGLNRIGLASSIAPGGQQKFSYRVTAPSTPGTYNFQWRMVNEGVEWFGQTTANVAVAVKAANALPTISVTRTPAQMTAEQSFSLAWSTTNATSLKRVCAASGTGFSVSDAPAVPSGSTAGTASASWVGFPSTCTWTANGAGGSTTFSETMTTLAATPKGVTYIHTDGLGSPVARTDATGKVISTTQYEPYGLTAAGATPTIGFTGHANDADTGLVYMQQRYYDPVPARFLSIDPVTTDATTGRSFNRYAYANNSPYKYIDPDGRSIVDVAFLAIDLYRLGSAVVSGEGVAIALVDVGISALGVASPVPFVGQAMKGARTAEHLAQAVKAAEKSATKYVEGGKFSQKTRRIAAERAGNKCEYCGTKTEQAQKSEKGVSPPKNEGQTDHIDPRSKGGTNSPENAAHACRECNRTLSDTPKPNPREN